MQRYRDREADGDAEGAGIEGLDLYGGDGSGAGDLDAVRPEDDR